MYPATNAHTETVNLIYNVIRSKLKIAIVFSSNDELL